MKSLERGQDRIQKICHELRVKTLEPAQEEAKLIIEEAKLKAAERLKEAEYQAEQLIKQTRGHIEQERNVFNASLQQAAKQAIEKLRQEIEHHLFNEELQQFLDKQLADPKLVAELINGIVKALEKEGLDVDLSVTIPQLISSEAVNATLIENARKRLKNRPLELGKFVGGAQVKLHGQQMTIDLSDQAIKELLANYLRKDFRQIVFS